MTTTAISSGTMHQIDDGANRVDVRLGQHAVTQIENVPGFLTGTRENVANPGVAFGGRRQQGGRIEIALNRAGADATPGGVQGNPPVHADDGAAGGSKVLEKRRCPCAEVNDGDTRIGCESQRAAAVFLKVGTIVVMRQAPNPAVEVLPRRPDGPP